MARLQYYRFGKWNDITEKNYFFAFDSDNGHEIRSVENTYTNSELFEACAKFANMPDIERREVMNMIFGEYCDLSVQQCVNKITNNKHTERFVIFVSQFKLKSSSCKLEFPVPERKILKAIYEQLNK